MADSTTIFSHPWFLEIILPFLLVFTIIFAILDKSKMLGDDKRQINAIVSLVIALIFIAFPFEKSIIVKLSLFLVVCVFIIFVFMLIYGFISAKKEGDMLDRGLKIALGIIFGIAVIVAVLWITGAWERIYTWVQAEGYAENIILNIFILAIIGGAIAIVLSSGGKSGSKT
jgi:hypothetical protein